MMWWETKEESGSTTYPFELEIDYSRITQVLTVKLAQLNIDLENNMPGLTKRIKKWLQLTTNNIKR